MITSVTVTHTYTKCKNKISQVLKFKSININNTYWPWRSYVYDRLTSVHETCMGLTNRCQTVWRRLCTTSNSNSMLQKRKYKTRYIYESESHVSNYNMCRFESDILTETRKNNFPGTLFFKRLLKWKFRGDLEEMVIL
jgi:hypothetical protein